MATPVGSPINAARAARRPASAHAGTRRRSKPTADAEEAGAPRPAWLGDGHPGIRLPPPKRPASVLVSPVQRPRRRQGRPTATPRTGYVPMSSTAAATAWSDEPSTMKSKWSGGYSSVNSSLYPASLPPTVHLPHNDPIPDVRHSVWSVNQSFLVFATQTSAVLGPTASSSTTRTSAPPTARPSLKPPEVPPEPAPAAPPARAAASPPAPSTPPSKPHTPSKSTPAAGVALDSDSDGGSVDWETREPPAVTSKDVHVHIASATEALGDMESLLSVREGSGGLEQASWEASLHPPPPDLTMPEVPSPVFTFAAINRKGHVAITPEGIQALHGLSARDGVNGAEVVVVVGRPGSGKSTWINRFLKAPGTFPVTHPAVPGAALVSPVAAVHPSITRSSTGRRSRRSRRVRRKGLVTGCTATNWSTGRQLIVLEANLDVGEVCMAMLLFMASNFIINASVGDFKSVLGELDVIPRLGLKLGEHDPFRDALPHLLFLLRDFEGDTVESPIKPGVRVDALGFVDAHLQQELGLSAGQRTANVIRWGLTGAFPSYSAKCLPSASLPVSKLRGQDPTFGAPSYHFQRCVARVRKWVAGDWLTNKVLDLKAFEKRVTMHGETLADWMVVLLKNLNAGQRSTMASLLPIVTGEKFGAAIENARLIFEARVPSGNMLPCPETDLMGALDDARARAIAFVDLTVMDSFRPRVFAQVGRDVMRITELIMDENRVASERVCKAVWDTIAEDVIKDRLPGIKSFPQYDMLRAGVLELYATRADGPALATVLEAVVVPELELLRTKLGFGGQGSVPRLPLGGVSDGLPPAEGEL